MKMAMKTMLRYDAPWPVFTLDWCNSSGSHSPRPSTVFRLAVGSFLESYQNMIQVVGVPDQTSLTENAQHDSDYFGPSNDFTVLAEVHHGMPATKLLWEPAAANGGTWRFKENRDAELLATSGEVLKLWEYDEAGNHRSGRRGGYVGQAGQSAPGTIKEVLKCTGAKGSNASAPLTSFAWNSISPSLIVTSSIDTTCTVWDINANSAITQLIAHDKDVYDVAWLPHSTDSFVSVGADGSLRAFDLRSLEHSTILYESPSGTPHIPSGPDDMVTTPARSSSSPPLARVVFNPTDANYIAMFHLDSPKVTIIDMRTPGRPLAELIAHESNVNAIGWSSCESATIATAGDDSQILLWDLSTSVLNQNRATPSDITNLPPPGEVREPVLAYTAPNEINSLAWSFPMVGAQFGGGMSGSPVEWLAISSGNTVRALRV